jgi:hypothetical protein
MRTAEELLESVFDLLEEVEKEDVDVISVQGLRHRVGTRSAFRARELVRDLAAVEAVEP